MIVCLGLGLRLILGANEPAFDPHRAVGGQRHEGSGKSGVAGLVFLAVQSLDAAKLLRCLRRHFVAMLVLLAQGIISRLQLG